MRLPVIVALAAGFLATACGSSKPVTAGAGNRYEADSAACEKSAAETVNKQNAKRALTWFASSVTRWSKIDDSASHCLQAKGWGTTRPCTDEELRRGSQTASLVVTARGISCKDSGRPS